MDRVSLAPDVQDVVVDCLAIFILIIVALIAVIFRLPFSIAVAILLSFAYHIILW